jgi:hypothetical protein
MGPTELLAKVRIAPQTRSIHQKVDIQCADLWLRLESSLLTAGRYADLPAALATEWLRLAATS